MAELEGRLVYGLGERYTLHGLPFRKGYPDWATPGYPGMYMMRHPMGPGSAMRISGRFPAIMDARHVFA